jgi:hypothetical protein
MNSWSSAQQWTLGLAIGAGMAISTALFGTSPAIAAERVVLKYKIFEGSVSLHDLSRFAETGATTTKLRRYLHMSGQDPERVRQTLTNDVAINPTTLERLLNSPAGEVVLNRLNQYVYTPHRTDKEDREAMRTALTRSSSDDGRVSLLEIMENYPEDDLYVNGSHLIATYNQLQSISSRFSDLMEGRFDTLLEGIHF